MSQHNDKLLQDLHQRIERARQAQERARELQAIAANTILRAVQAQQRTQQLWVELSEIRNERDT